MYIVLEIEVEIGVLLHIGVLAIFTSEYIQVSTPKCLLHANSYDQSRKKGDEKKRM